MTLIGIQLEDEILEQIDSLRQTTYGILSRQKVINALLKKALKELTI